MVVVAPPPLCNPPPPKALQSPTGGGQSPSDGLPGGGGGIARIFQGKLWYPPLMQANSHGAMSGDSGDLGDATTTASSLEN